MSDTPLIVTRGDGIPVPDQAMGVELFKAQCRIGALNSRIVALEQAYAALHADARLVAEAWNAISSGNCDLYMSRMADTAAERILSRKEKT